VKGSPLPKKRGRGISKKEFHILRRKKKVLIIPIGKGKRGKRSSTSTTRRGEKKKRKGKGPGRQSFYHDSRGGGRGGRKGRTLGGALSSVSKLG